MASSRRKIVSIFLLLLVGICLTLLVLSIACSRSLSQSSTATPLPFTVADAFPATDIVYRAASGLGFINADGSGGTTIPFKLVYIDLFTSWDSPLIAGDGETLIVTDTNYPGNVGDIFVAHAGDIVVNCKWYGIPRLAVDEHYVVLETFEGQEKYLLEDCGMGNPPEKVYPGVVGALSPDEQYSAEADRGEYGAYTEPNIVIHNLETGEKRIIGEGDFPVWSRDGHWLSYTGVDGIYIVQNIPNVEPRRLIALESPEPSIGALVYEYRPSSEYFPPIGSWSPDGKWLVYHDYQENPNTFLGVDVAPSYSIVKVNVETGETTKLLDGGLSPFWRWPAEEK
ncbi:MAG: hypothetical protein FJZ87_11960 [Chloroflexi bacterium]|nr:hypothetical protein [Chloroflexota bacterium]